MLTPEELKLLAEVIEHFEESGPHSGQRAAYEFHREEVAQVRKVLQKLCPHTQRSRVIRLNDYTMLGQSTKPFRCDLCGFEAYEAI